MSSSIGNLPPKSSYFVRATQNSQASFQLGSPAVLMASAAAFSAPTPFLSGLNAAASGGWQSLVSYMTKQMPALKGIISNKFGAAVVASTLLGLLSGHQFATRHRAELVTLAHIVLRHPDKVGDFFMAIGTGERYGGSSIKAPITRSSEALLRDVMQTRSLVDAQLAAGRRPDDALTNILASQLKALEQSFVATTSPAGTEQFASEVGKQAADSALAALAPNIQQRADRFQMLRQITGALESSGMHGTREGLNELGNLLQALERKATRFAQLTAAQAIFQQFPNTDSIRSGDAILERSTVTSQLNQTVQEINTLAKRFDTQLLRLESHTNDRLTDASHQAQQAALEGLEPGLRARGERLVQLRMQLDNANPASSTTSADIRQQINTLEQQLQAIESKALRYAKATAVDTIFRLSPSLPYLEYSGSTYHREGIGGERAALANDIQMLTQAFDQKLVQSEAALSNALNAWVVAPELHPELDKEFNPNTQNLSGIFSDSAKTKLPNILVTPKGGNSETPLLTFPDAQNRELPNTTADTQKQRSPFPSGGNLAEQAQSTGIILNMGKVADVGSFRTTYPEPEDVSTTRNATAEDMKFISQLSTLTDYEFEKALASAPESVRKAMLAEILKEFERRGYLFRGDMRSPEEILAAGGFTLTGKPVKTGITWTHDHDFNFFSTDNNVAVIFGRSGRPEEIVTFSKPDGSYETTRKPASGVSGYTYIIRPPAATDGLRFSSEAAEKEDYLSGPYFFESNRFPGVDLSYGFEQHVSISEGQGFDLSQASPNQRANLGTSIVASESEVRHIGTIEPGRIVGSFLNNVGPYAERMAGPTYRIGTYEAFISNPDKVKNGIVFPNWGSLVPLNFTSPNAADSSPEKELSEP